MVGKVEISVVIPIYGNENSLIELSNRLMDHLSSFNFEIVYVNDHSPDASLEILKTLAFKHQQIKFLDLRNNIGQQKATLEGLKKTSGKKIVVLDGDLQDTPELISRLYHMVGDEKEVAFVQRKGIYERPIRMLTSQIIKRVIQAMSGLHYKAGSYYIFDRSILSKVILVASKCQYPYISIIVAHFAKYLKYIPADRSKSLGDSGYSFTKRLRAALMAIYCSIYCTYAKLTLD